LTGDRMGSAIQEVGYIMASKAKSAAVVSCLTGVLLVFAGCGGTRDPVGERVYELTLHHHDPATASQGMFFDELAAEAIRRSNGRLKISVFHGAQLGSARDTVDMVLNGTCDIGGGLPSSFPGVFPMTEALTLPLIGVESSAQATEALWELFTTTDYLKDEYSEFKVLLLIGMNYSSIATTAKKITSVDQLKGMKLRANSGPPTDFVIEAGATPVSIMVGELYSSLERSVIDGVITDWNAFNAFKLYDRLNYILDERVTVNPYFVLMNRKNYEALPGDLRAILDELTQTPEARASFAARYDRITDEMKKRLKERGSEIYNLSAEQRARLKEIADAANARWVKKKAAGGYPAQKVMERIVELLDKHRGRGSGSGEDGNGE